MQFKRLPPPAEPGHLNRSTVQTETTTLTSEGAQEMTRRDLVEAGQRLRELGAVLRLLLTDTDRHSPAKAPRSSPAATCRPRA